MKLTFLKGVALGAATSMLTLTAGAALAGTGVGAVFNLGKTNKVNATSTLTGSTNHTMLQVSNTSAGGGARGIHVTNASASAAAIAAENTRGGPAAAFTSSGPAVLFKTPFTKPPFEVSGTGEVFNLNAEFVDGVTSAAFLPADGTAVDASALGGVPASGYQRACGHGSILDFAHVAASPSFSASYDTLSGGFTTCSFGIFAKRVAQGDYRVLACGIDGTANPIALVTDTSFSNFAGIQLVPADSDATTTCVNVGTSVLSEFKVTTRDTSGLGLDEPFNFAQLGS